VSAAVSRTEVTELDEWDRAELAFLEQEEAKRALAEALALHWLATEFLKIRSTRFQNATGALALALTEAVEAREELLEAVALAAETARLVAMREDDIR
jgi:hypothetical protein